MITVKAIADKSAWENFLGTRAEANFLQSWHWGEFHSNLGHTIQRSGFYIGEQLVGAMLSIIEPARRARYLTVPAGPIIDWKNSDLVAAFKAELIKIAKQEHCVFVRVRPQLINDQFARDLFRRLDFKAAPMHLHAELTSQLDITKSADELMANMRQNTRYELRRAIKKNIKITTSTNPDDIKPFYELQLATAQRHKFIPFSYRFLHEQFKVFSSADKTLLYSAHLDGELIAQAFVIFYGVEAAYHYGASTERGRKLPGAYLIQWEAIKEAKTRGQTRYNFWGVVGEDQTHHRFYGVSVFKRGFRGQDIEYLHAQDLIINKPRYLLNWVIEQTRKRTRHL